MPAREVHERGPRERHAHEVHVHEIHAYEVHACEMRAYERHTLMITREMRISVRCTAVSLLALAFLCCFLYWTHFGFKIDAGKLTTLLTVKRVDVGNAQAYL
jgi:hypothetical protein